MTDNSRENTGSDAKMAFAQQLFREYFASCFWHLKPDLVVTEGLIPLIVKGLRLHGGRKGMLEADKLLHWADEGSRCP